MNNNFSKIVTLRKKPQEKNFTKSKRIMRNKNIKNVNPIISQILAHVVDAWKWILCNFSVSIVSKISWWMWHKATEFNHFWVIVLRSQVFRRLKELKLLAAEQEEAGLTNKMRKRVCTSSKKDHTSCVISLKISYISNWVVFMFGSEHR